MSLGPFPCYIGLGNAKQNWETGGRKKVTKKSNSLKDTRKSKPEFHIRGFYSSISIFWLSWQFYKLLVRQLGHFYETCVKKCLMKNNFIAKGAYRLDSRLSFSFSFFPSLSLLSPPLSLSPYLSLCLCHIFIYIYNVLLRMLSVAWWSLQRPLTRSSNHVPLVCLIQYIHFPSLFLYVSPFLSWLD